MIAARLSSRIALALAVAALGTTAQAQANTGTSAIYSCTTPDGRRLTSDRPIPACRAVEQRVLNSDGSLRMIVPPTLTADELAAKEADERRAAAARQAQMDAVRRDRHLKQRYPDEASHQRARTAALDTVRSALSSSEQRLAELQRERGPLMTETEFYAGRDLPTPLRQKIEANDVAMEAQRNAIATHRSEIDRITRLYDVELERLKKLWAGAAPGSLGPLPGAGVPVAADARPGGAPR